MECFPLLFLLAWLIPLSTKYAAGGINLIGTHDNMVQCISKEREALLQFKQGIEADHCGLLTSWDDQSDCCHWHGIRCNNHTGHVTSLELHGTGYDDRCLEGKISPSLLELKHLKYLDLSSNNFQDQPIPSFIGSLLSLEYLNLSGSGFGGKIPNQLANLSSLTSLDLSFNHGLDVKHLEWLSHLTLLRDIDLSAIDLSLATDWIQIVNNLPFLRVLHLEMCGLSQPLMYLNISTSLHVLDLAQNSFSYSSVFHWVFNLTRVGARLEYLGLPNNGILGPMPNAFGTVQSLSHLDLSSNRLDGPIPSVFGGMHSLSHLDLSNNQLEGSIPSVFGSVHTLSYLDLSNNKLEGPVPSVLGSMQSLSYLSLSANRIEVRIPEIISNLKHLAYLDLSYNNLQGNISRSIGNLCRLQELYLLGNNLSEDLSSIIHSLSCARKSLSVLEMTWNQLWGSIPNTIGAFSSLRKLDFGFNKLNGTIGQSLGQLSRLETLHLFSNSLRGTLSEHHFSNLSRLSDLDLSENLELVVNISNDWSPPFELNYVSMRACKLGPYFPNWLLSQRSVSFVDISNTGILDILPLSFWNPFSSDLEYLNVSQNRIYGVLPDPSKMTFSSVDAIDFSWNYIEGMIPSFLGMFTQLLLNNNMFSDSTALLCPKTKVQISYLDLSNNFLSGQLPDCWRDIDQLEFLRLDNNRFTGKLSTSIGFLKYIKQLYLQNNSFTGELPRSFENCTSLGLLDISYNSLTGYVPPGISNLKNLGILNLRNNKLTGFLSPSLCQLSHLQFLDLSLNHVSGTIPKCICNLTGMLNTTNILPADIYPHFNFLYANGSEKVMWKRKEQSFKNALGLVKYIAISDNQLQGQIPSEISFLRGLVSLDLARNNLTGDIPLKIGQLTSLQFLDLSSNHLYGEIPTSLAKVSSLEILDLSNNDLSGRIPLGTQLQGFDPAAYIGNPGLCGPPLPKCPGDEPPTSTPKGDDITEGEGNENGDIFLGVYISAVLGFIVGFWGVCGSLVLKRSWRHAYFRFLHGMKDRLHVMVAVNTARIWRT